MIGNGPIRMRIILIETINLVMGVSGMGAQNCEGVTSQAKDSLPCQNYDPMISFVKLSCIHIYGKSYNILHTALWNYKVVFQVQMSEILFYHVVHEAYGPMPSVFPSVRDNGYSWIWRRSSENPFENPA